MQDFHRIDAWKRAHILALAIRKAASQFPRGYADLRAQMIEAAESVPTNIVEGCGAATRKEFARFLDISIKSTFELEYQLQLSKDNGVMPSAVWRDFTDESVEIRRMLCGLRRSVLKADREEKERTKPLANGPAQQDMLPANNAAAVPPAPKSLPTVD